MALINRVSRLFKADFNAVLDHIEEPEQLLRQAIRDMEDELAASEQHIALCTQEQEALGARRAEMLASAGEFGQQLDLCFESGKEELARGIIRRKLEAERLLKRLDGEIEANGRHLAEQEKLNDENRATLDGLRQKAELIVSRTPAERDVGGREDIARIARELRVDDDEVEIAFLREKAARSRS
jgi:phage shock protein A